MGKFYESRRRKATGLKLIVAMVAGLPRILDIILSIPFLILLIFGGKFLLLLELMSSCELKESIENLKKDLFEVASVKGFYHKRAIEISKRVNLYQTKYNELMNKR